MGLTLQGGPSEEGEEGQGLHLALGGTQSVGTCSLSCCWVCILEGVCRQRGAGQPRPWLRWKWAALRSAAAELLNPTHVLFL